MNALSRKLELSTFLIPFLVWSWKADIAPGWNISPFLASSSFSFLFPSKDPLYTFLAHLFSMLPMGNAVFRVSIFSAFCLALATWLTFRAVRYLLLFFPICSIGSRSCLWFLWFVVVIVSVSDSLCLSMKPDVYALQAALLMGVIERALFAYTTSSHQKGDQASWNALFLSGLSLSSHVFLALFTFSGLIVLTIYSGFWRRCKIRGIAFAGILLLLGWFPSLWGTLQDLNLSPKMQKTELALLDGVSQVDSHVKWIDVNPPLLHGQTTMGKGLFLITVLNEQVGFCFFVFFLLGLMCLIPLSIPLSFAFFFWWVGGWCSQFIVAKEMVHPQLHGSFAAASFVMSVPIAVLLLSLFSRLMLIQRDIDGVSKRREDSKEPTLFFEKIFSRSLRVLAYRVTLAMVCCVLVFPLMLSFLRAFSIQKTGSLPDRPMPARIECCRSSSFSSILWGELTEEDLARGALVLTNSRQTGFLREYRDYVEQSRLDLNYCSRTLIFSRRGSAGKRSGWKGRERICALFRKKDPLFLSELAKIAKDRSIYVEWTKGFPAKMPSQLYPVGFFFQWYPNEKVRRTKDGHASDDQEILEQQEHFWNFVYDLLWIYLKNDQEINRILLGFHLRHCDLYIWSGRWRAAKAELDRAAKIEPNNEELKNMKRLIFGR